jgi:hypothetical protein
VSGIGRAAVSPPYYPTGSVTREPTTGRGRADQWLTVAARGSTPPNALAAVPVSTWRCEPTAGRGRRNQWLTAAAGGPPDNNALAGVPLSTLRGEPITGGGRSNQWSTVASGGSPVNNALYGVPLSTPLGLSKRPPNPCAPNFVPGRAVVPASKPSEAPIKQPWTSPAGRGVWHNAAVKSAGTIEITEAQQASFHDKLKEIEREVAANIPATKEQTLKAVEGLAKTLGLDVVVTPPEIAKRVPAAANAVPLRPFRREVFTDTTEVEGILKHPGFFPFEHTERLRNYGEAKPLEEARKDPVAMLPVPPGESPMSTFIPDSPDSESQECNEAQASFVIKKTLASTVHVTPTAEQLVPPPLKMVRTDRPIVGADSILTGAPNIPTRQKNKDAKGGQ